MIEVNHIVSSCTHAEAPKSLKHAKRIPTDGYGTINLRHNHFRVFCARHFNGFFAFACAPQVVEGKHSVYRMSAATEEDKLEWMKRLEQSIGKAPFPPLIAMKSNELGTS